jgi:hypothetical protein
MKQKRKIKILFSSLLGIALAVTFSCSSNNAPTTTTTTTTSSTGLIVSVATSTAGGNYAPRHVVAIWIENSAGVFIKTLTVYAQARATDLTNWETASGGNKVDAVTGATQSSFGTLTAHWDGTDTKSAVVADGTYRVCMELTDKSTTGNFSYYTFTKSTTAETQTPADVASFSNISIKWVPL